MSEKVYQFKNPVEKSTDCLKRNTKTLKLKDLLTFYHAYYSFGFCLQRLHFQVTIRQT